MRGFNEVAGFPKVIGAIDGTLIPFRTPFENEHLYVCHKGFHAINVMATCNARLLFTNVVAKWHGLTHDSAVFNASMLNIHLESGDLLEYLNKDLDALIFLVGQCSLGLVDAAKSSLQQLSYATCVSLIIPHCQKLRGLLKEMMIIRKSAMSHQAPVVVSQ